MVGVIFGGHYILHHAGLNLRSVIYPAHLLKAAQVWTFVGYRYRFRLFSFIFDIELISEVFFHPFFSSLVVEYKFMHVVA